MTNLERVTKWKGENVFFFIGLFGRKWKSSQDFFDSHLNSHYYHDRDKYQQYSFHLLLELKIRTANENHIYFIILY